MSSKLFWNLWESDSHFSLRLCVPQPTPPSWKPKWPGQWPFGVCFPPDRGPPRWLSGKESACNSGDVGLIPGWGRSPGGGNGNPLQYSCLGNPTGEPGGLQSMGSQRVRHNWAAKQQQLLTKCQPHPPALSCGEHHRGSGMPRFCFTA